MLTMQDVLLRLTDFWASRGCVIAQPMNTEVGAGTLNPATFLRVLGPEPWRVAYVEPSVRPDDSRYGENPNRFQMYDQYQVILKPEPGDTQQIYLDSLCALGIDIRRHDVRFVEDDWAQPAIGAWGLGWEVWLDGLEITQFTYFQQAGGIYLDPVAVEITYGVERIMMALQGVTHIKDITYAPGVSYGEAFGQAEYEMSRYYLDDADIQANRALFDLYLGEARRLLELRLPVPAYSYILKCSHTFNVLDARGAIGTTERARTFAVMRQLAHQVAELWTERRAELGHPLGYATAEPPPERSGEHPTKRGEGGPPEAPATLAFEIGVEEMPAGEVNRAAGAVGAALAERLAATRLGHGQVRVFSTPRRIGVVVEAVEPSEADSQEALRGPRASAAFDSEGRPTPAASGFARKQGVEVGDLQRLTVEGTEYVGVVRRALGRTAGEVMASILPEVVASLRAEKNMRWNAPGLAFTRPIRWLLCLLGDEVVPLRVSNLEAGRTTRGMLTKAGGTVELAAADRYLEVLAELGIVPDFQERRTQILSQAAKLAAEVGGRIGSEEDSALVDEVANLCEQPVAVAGSFDTRYLELPAEVLTTVMKKHQRYLPVRSGKGELLPRFVAIADGLCEADMVRAGNESVLRARYEDALFFWNHDLITPLERMREKLASLTFEERLGSMADRAGRIAAVATELGSRLRLDAGRTGALARAAELAKFDLGSQMVMELTSLAGVMAREYAGRAGEPPEVAEALFDMEQPLSAGLVGAVLALADRADLLAGMFAIGAEPSGSSDPFGLRRAALGLTAMLRQDWFSDSPLTVPELLELAGRHQPVELSEAARDQAWQFVLRRLEQSLLDELRFDVVQAVLPLGSSPWRALRAGHSLTGIIDSDDFSRLVTAIQRVIRIVPAGTSSVYDPALFEAEAEHGLHRSLETVRSELGDGFVLPERFMEVATKLVEPIDRFFVDVLVMAPDPPVRANRLGLLAAIAEMAVRVLDWRAIE